MILALRTCLLKLIYHEASNDLWDNTRPFEPA